MCKSPILGQSGPLITSCSIIPALCMHCTLPVYNTDTVRRLDSMEMLRVSYVPNTINDNII